MRIDLSGMREFLEKDNNRLFYYSGLLAATILCLVLFKIGATLPLLILLVLLALLQALDINTALFIIIIGNVSFTKEFAYINVGILGVPLYITEFFMLVFFISLLLSVLAGSRYTIPADLLTLVPFLVMGAVYALLGISDFGMMSIRHFAIVYYSIVAFIAFIAFKRDEFRNLATVLFISSGVMLLIYNLQFIFEIFPVKLIAANVIGSSAVFVIFLYYFRSRTSGRARYLFDLLLILPILGFLWWPKSSLLLSLVVAAVAYLVFSRFRISFGMRQIQTAGMFVLAAIVSIVFQISIKSGEGYSGRLIGEFVALVRPVIDVVVWWEPADYGKPMKYDQAKRDNRISEYYENSQLNNAHWRFVVWSSLIKQVSSKNILFGIGFGPDFTAPELKELGYAWEERIDPHNSYLQILLRMGIIGLLLFALPIAFILIKALFRVKRLPAEDGKRLAVFTALFSALMTQAMLNVVLENAFCSVPLWFALGIITAIAFNPPESEEEGASASKPLPEPQS